MVSTEKKKKDPGVTSSPVVHLSGDLRVQTLDRNGLWPWGWLSRSWRRKTFKSKNPQVCHISKVIIQVWTSDMNFFNLKNHVSSKELKSMFISRMLLELLLSPCFCNFTLVTNLLLTINHLNAWPLDMGHSQYLAKWGNPGSVVKYWGHSARLPGSESTLLSLRAAMTWSKSLFFVCLKMERTWILSL